MGAHSKNYNHYQGCLHTTMKPIFILTKAILIAVIVISYTVSSKLVLNIKQTRTGRDLNSPIPNVQKVAFLNQASMHLVS